MAVAKDRAARGVILTLPYPFAEVIKETLLQLMSRAGEGCVQERFGEWNLGLAR